MSDPGDDQIPLEGSRFDAVPSVELEAAHPLKLSERDSLLILDLLENPSPANARLWAAATSLPLATMESLSKELGKLSP